MHRVGALVSRATAPQPELDHQPSSTQVELELRSRKPCKSEKAATSGGTRHPLLVRATNRLALRYTEEMADAAKPIEPQGRTASCLQTAARCAGERGAPAASVC